MEELNGQGVLCSAVTPEEWNQIPIEIAKKLQIYMDEKVDELVTSKALSETKKYDAETSVNELQEKLTNADTKLNEVEFKYEAATRTIKELEVQVTTCTSDMNKFQSTFNRLESEAADFRHQRNLAFGERDEYAQSLERRKNEVERLNQELSAVKQLMQDAVNNKCAALADAQEIEALKVTFQHKERLFEQERTNLLAETESLSFALSARTEELMAFRKDNSLRCVQLENKLFEKNEEVSVANESLKQLGITNNNLIKKIEELTEKLKSDRDKDSKTYHLYQQELEAQSKLTELYKSMSDKNNAQVEELSKDVSELQTFLHEATEKYDDLEVRYKQQQLSNEEMIQKKNECIEVLRHELSTNSESLKTMQDENILRDMENLSPAAATASKLLAHDMSLNQLVTQNSTLNIDLIRIKEENQRLNSYLEQIVGELQDKGPMLRKQLEDYENSTKTIKNITQHNEDLVLENHQLREEALLCKKNEAVSARENVRLKKEISDLSRQVCHLLHEIQLKSGSSSTSEQDMSDSISSGDLITKKLVTFSDIAELQETNRRLLAVVRDLSKKQEESEDLDPSVVAQMKMKLENLQENQQSLLDQQENQNKMMSMVIGQRDMYKTLYDQAIKGNSEDVPVPMERSYSLDDKKRLSSTKLQDSSDSDAEKDHTHDLEQQLEKSKAEINVLKDENAMYRKEKTANEKILIEQLEEMRKEVREVTRLNCRLTSTAEMDEERFKVIQANVEAYKNQLSALEKQNKIYSDSIIKHESMTTYLKNETLESQTKLSKAEVRLGNLEKQNALLNERESRLIKELEYVKKESHAKNVLQNNIELIKSTLERNDAERQIRSEERLDEVLRECAALRRRLQEEQDHFRELSSHVEKQKESIMAQMSDEKNAAERLRLEIAEAREELISKQTHIEDLTKKLKSSLLSTSDSTDYNKLREIERTLIDRLAEIESLQQQLKIANNTVQQHCSIAEGAEKQMKIMLDEQESYRKLTETKLREKEAHIMKLEEQCSELQGELSIQNEGPDAVTLDLRGNLNRLQEELSNVKTNLEDTMNRLEAAKTEIITLTTNLEEAQDKYTREMYLHSNDLQTLTTIKEELSTTLKEVNELKLAKEQAVAMLEESKEGFATQEEFFKKEKEELQKRFKDMDGQNALLLDQIQQVNAQLTIIQSQKSDQNVSIGAAGDANLSKSFTEDDVKSSDQLLKIIKYLRQEKDISVSKCEIFEAEHLKLKSRYESLCKQLDEAKLALENEKQNSEASEIIAIRQSEVLRKVETLNAITDSNRALRQERDTLATQLSEFKERIALLEDEVAPLQEMNKELSSKVESVQSENVTLRGEATRWRQRANILIEKSNRTSPEDLKKLQAERDNLAKQLIIERGNVAKLNDDLNNLRTDKSKVDDQLRALKLQQSQMTEEFDKMRDDLQKLKEQVGNVSQELEQTKENYTKLIQEKNKFEESCSSKSDAISELKGNLIAVKKIAKKYKQQSEDLSSEANALKQDIEVHRKKEVLASEKYEQLQSSSRSELENRVVQLEQSHNVKLAEITQQLSTVREEVDTRKKEYEALRNLSEEKEDRFKLVFKNAKERIVTLTGENSSLSSRLDGKQESAEDVSDNSVDVEKLLQEKKELIVERQTEKEKHITEVESLNQRIMQLQRQLGQQSSKPSTSSSSSEKPNTEPPTANIKPMAGHSTNTQTQSVQIQPWRSGPETPLASIRPMSMQLRTVAVLPTSQSSSTCQGLSAAIVPPQQVHTTGPSTSVEPLSNSPTSSHTEYMPATSSATPTAVASRQVAVPPTQSTQDTEDEDSSSQAQPAQQAVAMVLPRVEPPSNGPAQESGTSSSSSNTVTTTQASLKRQRDVDNDGSHSEEQQKCLQQKKRTCVQQSNTDSTTVTDSGLDVEYQVPTSSQRDHEEDNDGVIVVESDEDGDGPDEGEEADDDPDTGYDMEAYPEQELNFDDAECQEMEEDASNEAEIVDDSNEVPNQSEQSLQDSSSKGSSSEQPQSETISSGSDGASEVTVSQASTSVAPTFSRTRPIAPLSRQQQSHLLLPHGIEEGGDDGIVPSTPTLFVPRRSDGFSEAVSSPNVPTSAGRFTFNESTPPSTSGSVEAVPEQTLEFSSTDDNGTGRSVPGTPLQSSPQEQPGPSGIQQSTQQNIAESIPSITVSGVPDEPDATPDGNVGPSTYVTVTASQPSDAQNDEPENEDGVTSEGEKDEISEESEVEDEDDEDREAEASPSTNTRSRSNGSRLGLARRSIRSNHMRAGINRTPITWNNDSQNRQHNRGRPLSTNFSSRVARRSRGRVPRGGSMYQARF